jgi:hypothetical protein
MLLDHQQCIGWEFFLKGFLAKEWRYIQGSYYKFLQVNPRKYSPDRWVLQVMMLLHQYRHDLWMMRNASLHGGEDVLYGKALRDRLLTEVKELYARDRSLLSISDKDVFKLPLSYRRKQGNQQLQLWVSHAHIIFDRVDETIPRYQQVPITEWLTNWTENNTPSIPIPPFGVSPNTKEISHQSMIDDWLHSGQTNMTDGECLSLNVSDDETYPSDGEDTRITYRTDLEKDLVTDGIHQYDTTNTCVLVR